MVIKSNLTHVKVEGNYTGRGHNSTVLYFRDLRSNSPFFIGFDTRGRSACYRCRSNGHEKFALNLIEQCVNRGYSCEVTYFKGRGVKREKVSVRRNSVQEPPVYKKEVLNKERAL